MSQIELASTAAGFLASWAGGKGVDAFVAGYKAYRDRSTNAFREDTEARLADYQEKCDEALRTLAARLESEGKDRRAQIASIIGDPELGRVHLNLRIEASREAIDERLGMLAYVEAGTTDAAIKGMSIAEVARVERTIRELDPDDVRRLSRLPRKDDPKQPRYDYMWDPVLLAAGCVAPHPAGMSTACSMSPVGLNVLKVMDLYLRALSPEDSTPEEPTT